MKLKYMIGLAVILVFAVFAGVNFRQTLTPYVSIDKAKAKGTTVQIKGPRVVNSEHYNAATRTFNFQLTDEHGDPFPVVYNGVKPSNFERATHVVAKGRFQNGVFHANEVLIKCPSKYETETAPVNAQ